jgi:hypothetical protein
VANLGPSDNEIVPTPEFLAGSTRTPDARAKDDDAAGKHSFNGHQQKAADDAFDHFRSVSREPHTSASEKVVASAVSSTTNTRD